jgi:hypothetical protein
MSSSQYQAVVAVRLNVPLRIDSEDLPAIGYTIVLGVNAESFLDAVESVHNAALAAAPSRDDNVVDQMEIRLVDPDDWDKDVRKEIEDIYAPGIFYQSGLAYFQSN